MPRNPKQDENLKKGEATQFRSGEDAARKGRKGGKKSGEVRRKQRDIKDAVSYFLSLQTSNVSDKNLEKIGVPEEERTNLMALIGALHYEALSGNLEAARLLTDLSGATQDAIRKERESIASDRRKDLELNAKLTALGNNPDSRVSMSFGDEEGSGGVVIYLPEIDKEEDCEVDEPDPEEELPIPE